MQTLIFPLQDHYVLSSWLKGGGVSITNDVPVVNAPHHNAFMVDPNLEEIDYEDKDEDSAKEEEYEHQDFEDARDYSQDEDF